MQNTNYYHAIEQLNRLAFLPQKASDVAFIDSPAAFKQTLLDLIGSARHRIIMTALYWQNDNAGQEILDALYRAKKAHPEMDVCVLVDLHRAQRGRLGEEESQTNAQWYEQQRLAHNLPAEQEICFWGIPINTRELFGVLHLKGFVFDDTVLYSGASINDVYLHQHERYRYDRYQKITNAPLANAMVNFVQHVVLNDTVVKRLDHGENLDRTLRPQVRQYRKTLASEGQYIVPNGQALSETQLQIAPIFGLGNHNLLNTTIENLFNVVQQKLIICTPYFNLPRYLQHQIKQLINDGKQVEIIVGDKTASDFYTPPDAPFHMASALPYLYEMNLCNFCKKFQTEITEKLLTIRIWQHNENSYHLKGVWVDNDYILLTGNNLNPRAWRLDAENGLLIHDPEHELLTDTNRELEIIRSHTSILHNYQFLDRLEDYPAQVKRLLTRFKRIKADTIVKMIL
ncbi:CDP-diacylglycerol--serine O-phosphatidyltransferase [Pasteurellaceae bacterium HPA106]|uniref:CDP-diacylglycerol--serine O-phosphatidyltransferase n=1 Tax=Spirabiliibacterium pneumoniae TaxID=221400 RepID=UPI001AAD62E2|nr:CDP-diacylglycerol--serine O-phosphatidyltransferase [Spirabiliibacterium pneumoniae]MBE2896450.1 CDP-diacylglycerol--serine O-phosphatidyltransferase [Spirabiliibacterium pneumoniae]